MIAEQFLRRNRAPNTPIIYLHTVLGAIIRAGTCVMHVSPLIRRGGVSAEDQSHSIFLYQFVLNMGFIRLSLACLCVAAVTLASDPLSDFREATRTFHRFSGRWAPSHSPLSPYQRYDGRSRPYGYSLDEGRRTARPLQYRPAYRSVHVQTHTL